MSARERLDDEPLWEDDRAGRRVAKLQLAACSSIGIAQLAGSV